MATKKNLPPQVQRRRLRRPREEMGRLSVLRPTRVVHVAQSVAGGIASYFEEIAPYQSARFGRENVAFVVPGEFDYLPSLDSEQLIHFRSASRSPRSLLDFAKTARAAIRRLRPDIVHLHSSFAGAIVRSMLAHTSRPRVIYCPHGWAFAREISPAKQRAYALVERQLAKVTDLIHLNSRSEYDIGVQFGLPTQKMRVLANGIAWSPPADDEARDGPIRVAFIGRHDRQKGLDILIDTVQRFPVPGVHFDIVGDGILSERKSHSRAAASNMTFHGWLSRQQTLELLSRADAVVMPSRWDAAPLVATEAMRAGVPVIGSNRGGIPEIVEHGVGGYIFDLEDQGSLARILQSLHRDELRRLGKSARKRWERHYVSDRMNDLTCKAYEHVLQRVESRLGGDAITNGAPPSIFRSLSG